MDKGKCKVADKKHALSMKQECSRLWSSPSADGFLSSPFSSRKLIVAINQVKSARAQGPDSIQPEFLKNCESKCRAWLKKFYSIYLLQANTKDLAKSDSSGVSNTPNDDPKTVVLKLGSTEPLGFGRTQFKNH